MSNTDDKFYETKNTFFHAFVKFTVKAIIGTAIFLAILAVAFV